MPHQISNSCLERVREEHVLTKQRHDPCWICGIEWISLNDDLAAQMLGWKLSQASAAAFRRQILQIRAMSERNILKSNLDEVPEELSRLWPSSKHPTQSNDMGVTNNNKVDNINQIETNSLIGSSTPSQIDQITLMSTLPKSFGSTVPNLIAIILPRILQT